MVSSATAYNYTLVRWGTTNIACQFLVVALYQTCSSSLFGLLVITSCSPRGRLTYYCRWIKTNNRHRRMLQVLVLVLSGRTENFRVFISRCYLARCLSVHRLTAAFPEDAEKDHECNHDAESHPHPDIQRCLVGWRRCFTVSSVRRLRS